MTAYIQDAIVLLGDSITQGGWAAGGIAQRLAYDYARKFDVVNRGFSGYNTNWAIPIFEQCLAKKADQAHTPKVRLLTIWYGANDACIPGSFQHVPLERFEANLTHLINMVKSPASEWYSPETKVALITPPPVNTHQWSAERTFDTTAAYAQAVRDVGNKEGIVVVDVWQALWDSAGKEEQALNKYLSDGLHLTSDGYRIAYDELMKAIRTHYPELHYENLQTVFPAWDQVDPKNFRACLERRIVDGQSNEASGTMN